MNTQFRSEQIDTNTEIGIVTHEGKEYRALGAVITDTHITAYLGKDGLTNWHGDVIGRYTLVASWPVHSYITDRMYQVEAWVGDKLYTGRSAGVGMVFNGKRVARQRKLLGL